MNKRVPCPGEYYVFNNESDLKVYSVWGIGSWVGDSTLRESLVMFVQATYSDVFIMPLNEFQRDYVRCDARGIKLSKSN